MFGSGFPDYFQNYLEFFFFFFIKMSVVSPLFPEHISHSRLPGEGLHWKCVGFGPS